MKIKAKVLLFIPCLLCSVLGLSQIQPPQTPQPTGVKSVYGNASNTSPYTPQYQQPGSQVRMGGTANDVTNQQNRNSRQGQSDESASEGQKKQQQQLQEIENLIKENQKFHHGSKYELPSNSGKPDVQCYYQAYDKLNKILTNGNSVDIKNAVFTVENAFMGNKMSYEKFNNAIQDYVRFYKLKFAEEKLTPNSNEDKNNLLFRLLSDTLTTVDPVTKKKLTHYPVNYDFDDYMGSDDYRNMFVSKLLMTNYGQCHSMPLLYLILAHEVGAEAFLVAAPNHLFVKYRNGVQWKNVELTNGHITTDAYALGSGYITSAAIKNKIYLDTFSKQNIIGAMLEDLAEGYTVKYGDDEFVPKCLFKAKELFPNSIRGMQLLANFYFHQLRYVFTKTGTDMNDDSVRYRIITTIPEANAAYLNRGRMGILVDESGYRAMPAEAYAHWLKSIDEDKMDRQYQQYLMWKKENKSYITNSLDK